MNLSYASATVSARYAAVLRTSAPCPLPEKWCGTPPKYFKEYSVSGPTIEAMQMQTRNHDLGTYL